MPLCQLCRKDAPKLSKSHIIPEKMYGPTLTSPSGPAILIATDPLVRHKRSRKGEYDPDLLCKACETVTDSYDNYAYKSLFEQKQVSIVHDDGEPLAAVYSNVDVEKLRRFYCSLVWRMHQTTRPMFQMVQLGALSEVFREATLNSASALPVHMDVVISKFDTNNTAIFSPLRRRLEGLNGYQVSFAGYSSWIKIDNRPITQIFDEVALSARETEFCVLLTDYQTSPERRVAARIVKKVFQK